MKMTDKIVELMNDENLLMRIQNTLDKSKHHVEFYNNGYGIQSPLMLTTRLCIR